jgi:hypothetical protein
MFQKSSTLFVLIFTGYFLFGQEAKVTKNEIILSAIKGTRSRIDTISITSTNTQNVGEILITGEHSNFFTLLSPQPDRISSFEPGVLAVVFEPDESFTGIARAELGIENLKLSIRLTGLSTKGLEGENEAPLSLIVDALGYNINVGWSTLPNHLKPELQGEELPPAFFRKASEGKVEMIPVARYSPDFSLNFGFYIPSEEGPDQNQVGILAKAGKLPEHQILFPALSSGQTTFDPGNSAFGFYAISPDHTIYSEDTWNILFYPSRANHAMRIYPVKNEQGKMIENTYLVCMEEAANGDYNDYVFLVKNVKPIFLQEEYKKLLNGKNLDGWYSWLQGKGKNNDPDNIFTFEQNGVLHDLGKELGYIMTEESFGNYHFVLEFRWGEKRWPPRESNKRDSGICYNIPEDCEDQIWPPSIECQIQEGDVGDFWLLGFSTIQVDGKQNPPLKHSQIVKKKDNENPTGEWNTVEVISFNGKCAHIVNGVLVNFGENSSLIGGRILLQSEYAEVYYRNLRIREF